MVDVELRPSSGVLSQAHELCDFGLGSWLSRCFLSMGNWHQNIRFLQKLTSFLGRFYYVLLHINKHNISTSVVFVFFAKAARAEKCPNIPGVRGTGQLAKFRVEQSGTGKDGVKTTNTMAAPGPPGHCAQEPYYDISPGVSSTWPLRVS